MQLHMQVLCQPSLHPRSQSFQELLAVGVYLKVVHEPYVCRHMLTVKSKYHFIKEAQQEVGKQLRRYVAYRYAVPSVTME